MSDNLSSFMNLPRLEQLFGQLMAQLAQQEGEIAALKDRCAAAETTAARVGDLEAQLLRLETVAALPGGGSLGRRVVENGAAVARLADVVDRLGRDVAGFGASHEGHVASAAERHAALEGAVARKDHAIALEARLEAVNARVDLCASGLATKVDAADAAGLSATCERLRGIDGFVGEARGRLGVLGRDADADRPRTLTAAHGRRRAANDPLKLVDAAVRELLSPPGGAVAECRRRLASLESKHAVATHKVDLALKFVDWFHDRGDAYEHNMSAIDRRLDGMVVKQQLQRDRDAPSTKIAMAAFTEWPKELEDNKVSTTKHGKRIFGAAFKALGKTDAIKRMDAEKDWRHQ
ncbi:hypothetical protein JL721_8903 [Aureococcus anophagefferens]|nr:hypothetical protein JL721_8903 [Aureococcus anophagefferens]